jgi:protein gp37
MAKRLQGMGQPNYINGFGLTMHEDVLEKPLEWKKPQVIFVNSMSDLFHENVPIEFINKVVDVMRQAHWHTFQILTKRAERLEEISRQVAWPDNVWLGVSVENCDYTYRIEYLRHINAKIKFLSLEPLLGPLHNLKLDGIQWVIVGGESGPGARPIDPAWVVDIRDQCISAKVPFFFKQWGGIHKKKAGRILEGRTWNEAPAQFGFSSMQ